MHLSKVEKLKGPTMDELSEMRLGAAQEVASEKEFLQDPLKASTGVGQPTYELSWRCWRFNLSLRI